MKVQCTLKLLATRYQSQKPKHVATIRLYVLISLILNNADSIGLFIHTHSAFGWNLDIRSYTLIITIFARNVCLSLLSIHFVSVVFPFPSPWLSALDFLFLFRL